MNRKFGRHCCKGYTLVELIVVIAIMAVVVSIAYKGITQYFQHNESMQVRNDLQQFLTTGKQYTMIYQAPIHLCMANQNQQCVAENGSNLLTFIDKDKSNNYSNGDTLLEIKPLSLKYATLTMTIALARPYIIFSATTGRPTGYVGNIKYCPLNKDTKEMFKITFSKTAVIKVKTNKDESIEC